MDCVLRASDLLFTPRYNTTANTPFLVSKYGTELDDVTHAAEYLSYDSASCEDFSKASHSGTLLDGSLSEAAAVDILRGLVSTYVTCTRI